MVLLVMKDKRLTRPLIIDYFDNSNLLTYVFRYEFCQTSVSLYFPAEFQLQGHQRRDVIVIVIILLSTPLRAFQG